MGCSYYLHNYFWRLSILERVCSKNYLFPELIYENPENPTST